jgi:hypothetical protein
VLDALLALDLGRRDDGDTAPELVRQRDEGEEERPAPRPGGGRSDAFGELHGVPIAAQGRDGSR